MKQRRKAIDMNRKAAIGCVGERKVLVLHGWVMDAGVWLSTRAPTDLTGFAFVDFPGYGVNLGDVALPEGVDADRENERASRP
ncbi:hypothetical protein ACNHUS_08460 [Actinomycetes bacterium M1A6_2h]